MTVEGSKIPANTQCIVVLHGIINPSSAKPSVTTANIHVPEASDGVSLENKVFSPMEVLSLGYLNHTSLAFSEPTVGLTTAITVQFNYSKDIVTNDTVSLTLPGFGVDVGGVQVIPTDTSCDLAVLVFGHSLDDTHKFHVESGNISANAFCRFSVSGFKIASSVPTNYDEYKISVVAGAGSSGAVAFDSVDDILASGNITSFNLDPQQLRGRQPDRGEVRTKLLVGACFWRHHKTRIARF